MNPKPKIEFNETKGRIKIRPFV